MATCGACRGEKKRLGRYAGIAGSDTPEMDPCPDCDGDGAWCDWCHAATTDGGPCSDECARALAADVADDIAMEEQRVMEVSP